MTVVAIRYVTSPVAMGDALPDDRDSSTNSLLSMSAAAAREFRYAWHVLCFSN